MVKIIGIIWGIGNRKNNFGNNVTEYRLGSPTGRAETIQKPTRVKDLITHVTQTQNHNTYTQNT